MAAKRLLSVDFEAFGRVQGVFFRKYTREKAKELSLVGWVKNTKSNTVVGQVQGESRKVYIMKHWLKTQGSPQSRIDRCVFKNENTIASLAFTAFDIIRK